MSVCNHFGYYGKVRERPIEKVKRPIKAHALFSGTPPWWKTAPLKRPMKGSMTSFLAWGPQSGQDQVQNFIPNQVLPRGPGDWINFDRGRRGWEFRAIDGGLNFLVSPVSRKSPWINFGFKKVKLERNADNSGREFWAWIFWVAWNPGKTRPKNSLSRFAFKIRRRFSYNSPDPNKKITPNPLCITPNALIAKGKTEGKLQILFCRLGKTLIFFSLPFWKTARKITKKARISSACRTPKILGKEGKNAQNRKEFLEKEKGKRQGKPKSQGKEA